MKFLGGRAVQDPPNPAATRWLAACVLLVQGLHVFHLPITVAVLGPAMVLLRLALDWRGIRAPSLLLILIAILGAVLVRNQLGYLIGRDPGVAFLTIAAGLKLLELRSGRDVSFMLCLSAFLLPTVFFYGHSIPATMAVIAVGLVILAAFAALHDPNLPLVPKRALRLAGVLLLQGLPVALALFVLFPRLSGPLWTLSSERVGRTGLSDRMDPGMVTKLSLSDDIAFRVDFDGPVPAARDLYWRGPVLTLFDGRGWLAGHVPNDGQILIPQGKTISYQVSIEPHDRYWLFALELAASVPPQARLTRERQLLAIHPVAQAQQYSQLSVLADHFPASSAEELRLALLLPPTGNPRTREWARELRQQSASPGDLINRVLGTFRREPFHYTLEPPEYGSNGIDAFLFEQRRGFCEHYASAFAFLMRSAGIPARVVTGYQGGEVSPVGGYLIVRQADAHAWVEVWFADAWRRVDPTAAVAPERIERGLGAAVGAGERLPLLSRLDGSLLKNLRLHWDAVNYRWQRWVVEFNRERQQTLWRDWGFPKPEPWQIVGAILFLAAAWLGLLALWLLRRRRVDPAQGAWERFCARLGRAGLPRREYEAPLAYAERASIRWPQSAGEIRDVATRYCQARYGAHNRESLPGLFLAVRRLRLDR